MNRCCSLTLQKISKRLSSIHIRRQFGYEVGRIRCKAADHRPFAKSSLQLENACEAAFQADFQIVASSWYLRLARSSTWAQSNVLFTS